MRPAWSAPASLPACSLTLSTPAPRSSWSVTSNSSRRSRPAACSAAWSSGSARSSSRKTSVNAHHGRIVAASRAGRLRSRLVQDWWAAAQRPGERPPIMIALRHADVADLNQRARALLAQHGRLGPEPITIGGRDFAAGDRIVTLRNARQLGVQNGTFATVTAIDHQARALRVRTDDGRDLTLPRWYLDSHGWLGDRQRVDHAYAITCHKSQGMTTDRAFVLASDDLYRQWCYVSMSG